MKDSIFQSNTPRQFGFSSGNFLPARLDAKQAALVLGFQEHDIPVLVRRNLLEPLGRVADNEKKNTRKYFALVNILERAQDLVWLGKATKIVSVNWQEKNASRKANGDGEESSHTE